MATSRSVRSSLLLDALAEELADPLLVAAALGDEPLAALPFEVAPLADEDRREVELARRRRARWPRRASLIRSAAGASAGTRVERRVERFAPFPGDLPEQVLLRGDVVVERRLLHAERLRQVGEGRALVALLGEEAGGDPG